METVLYFSDLCLSIVNVALFSFAYPDRFRSKLWENGGVEGWNSNPHLRIYFYANHREPPEIPLIWAQRSTDSNLGIAIASLVICVVRGVTGRLRYSPWLAEVIYDLMLFVLWTTSILRQLSGDFSDPDHPSQHPWYLTHSCRASWEANRTFCGIAQASFVTSVLALLINSWRLVSDAVQAFRRARNNTWEKLEDDIETKLDSADLQPGTEFYDYRDEALSPILAFFVENTRVQH